MLRRHLARTLADPGKESGAQASFGPYSGSPNWSFHDERSLTFANLRKPSSHHPPGFITGRMRRIWFVSIANEQRRTHWQSDRRRNVAGISGDDSARDVTNRGDR